MQKKPGNLEAAIKDRYIESIQLLMLMTKNTMECVSSMVRIYSGEFEQVLYYLNVISFASPHQRADCCSGVDFIDIGIVFSIY